MPNQDISKAIHSLINRTIHVRRLDFEELAKINEEGYSLVEKHECCTEFNDGFKKRIESCKDYSNSHKGTKNAFIETGISTLNDLHDIETHLSTQLPTAIH